MLLCVHMSLRYLPNELINAVLTYACMLHMSMMCVIYSIVINSSNITEKLGGEILTFFVDICEFLFFFFFLLL